MRSLKVLLTLTVLFFWVNISPALSYDTTAGAQRICSHGGAMCSQPYPAQPCIGGLVPAGDCVCRTDFTLEFEQTVELSVNILDTDCGSGAAFNFILKNTSDVIVRTEAMTGPGMATKLVLLPAGTYRICEDQMGQPGGNYSVSYWAGPPRCTADINIAPGPNFGTINSEECSTWRTVTFTNDGNQTFNIGAISSSDPAFELDLGGVPATLEPGNSLTFRAKFCAPSGLAADTPFSALITVNYTCNSTPQNRQLTVSGTAHVRRGELSVVSSFDVGEADWTLPNNWVEKNLRIDNTGDASMTVNVMITNDGGGVFSLPLGGNVGSINGGSHKNVLVRATVTAETSYSGQLRVDANYGGGYSDSELVTLTATGHHPVPVLFLETNEINYREVEVGYYFHQAVKVRNDGDAPLTFDISLQDPADLDAGEFDLDLGHKGPIPGGEFRLYEMTFHPTSNGAKEIFLLINNTNEPTPTSATVRLYGSGTDPISLSTMLVLDRSGSMNGLCGDVKKIEAVRDAGILYTNLIRDAWDWLGITKYNQNNSTPVPLAAISSNRASAQTLLSDIAGELNPDGTTGIGGAMQKAAQEYSSSPAQNALAMILLTDGKENEIPWIRDVKPGILSTYPGLHIFCVGVGDPIETDPYAIEGVEISKLQAIAEDTDALFTSIRSFSGENRYALEAFYFKAFAKATDRQTVLDPIYYLPIANYLQQAASVEIVACDREADFLVISELFKKEGMGLQIFLQDPTGQIIESGALIGGIGVHVKSWGNCKLIRVKFPERDMSASYTGTWKLYLKPFVAAYMPGLTNLALTASGNIALSFMVCVGSDYRLEASLTKGEVLVGQPLHLTARTTEAWWPIPGADVTATITRPDGSVVTLQLHDDGLHGDSAASDAVFGVDFTATTLKGYYKFLIRSKGQTERGEDVVREMALSKYVGKYLPDVPETRGCFPCWLVRLIIVVILVLLLLILFYLLFCCCRYKFSRKG